MKNKTLIVLFNLKEGIEESDYQKWALEVDIPIAGSLKSVNDFKLYKTEGIFGSDQTPPFKYIEVIDINNFDSFPSDIAAEPRMNEVASKFQSLAESPIFLVTDKIAD